MSSYATRKKIDTIPRIPLNGEIDLTYRCNNNCRHCWLWIPENSPEKKKELTFGEIKQIFEEARNLGCREWGISGGEPMLRSDFIDIFDFITTKATTYSLNTNGTLITPQIARIMKRKGSKMVALYGATAKVHDHITRNPGSFDSTLQGLSYLREAGVGFMVQIIPMKDNFHQLDAMIELAKSKSPIYRIGASWLYLSAYGNAEKNREIMKQRLHPSQVVELDKPDLSTKEDDKEGAHSCAPMDANQFFFKSCIESRRSFHIDPYGTMTFCGFIKDPSLRLDIKNGGFHDCWEKFIPSLENKITPGKEYLDGCGSCDLRSDCRWCPVYVFLENRNFSSKIDYLCNIAKANRAFKDNWKKNHRRYFRIAGVTIRVDSDLEISENTFHNKFKEFEVDGPGEGNISVSHHFDIPSLDGKDLGKKLYDKPPWIIYQKEMNWIYLSVSPGSGEAHPHQVSFVNQDYSRIRIYNQDPDTFLRGGLSSLFMFSTDQVFLAHAMAHKNGCFIHSCGVIFGKKGLLFVGHSEAGKSTIADILKNRAEILCDDRIIVRKRQNGFRLYGTWSHGDVPDISPNSAPLNAILFLEKSETNRLFPLKNKKEIISRLVPCLVRALVTPDWWIKTLLITENIVRETPSYILEFNKSHDLVEVLKEAFGEKN